MRQFLILLVLGAAFCAQAAAQPSIPGGGSGDGNGNPESSSGGVFSDLLHAVESGSRLLISRMQPGEMRDLVDNPRFNSQKSPRAAVMTFTEAMTLVSRGYEEIGYARALGSLPEGATRQEADRLYAVFVRLGPVSAATLPGERQIERTGDTRFEFFPKGTDHLWVWSALDEPPTGEISLLRQKDGRWLFSQNTMAGLPELYEAMKSLPPRFGEELQGRFFIKAFAPLADRAGLVGWLAFFGTTALGIGLGYGIYRLGSWLGARSDERDHALVASTLRGLGASIGLVVFTALFTVALGFLSLGPVLRPLRYEIPKFLMVVAVAFLVVSLIDTISAFARRSISPEGSGHYDRMIVSVIRRILRTFVIVIVLLFILQNVMGIDVGALIVGFGVIGLALSLAAKDSVKNLFGAITIYVNRPFVVGDWIKFEGQMTDHWGVVQEIKLQATKVRDVNGNIVTLPNMQFIDREVQNLSAREYIRREVNIAIPYRPDGSEARRAIDTLRDVFNDDEVVEDAMSQERDRCHVSFPGFEDGWITIRGYHYYYMGKSGQAQRDTERGWFTYLDHCSLVNAKIMDLFGERNIEFAFPTQTVELIRGEDRE